MVGTLLFFVLLDRRNHTPVQRKREIHPFHATRLREMPAEPSTPCLDHLLVLLLPIRPDSRLNSIPKSTKSQASIHPPTYLPTYLAQKPSIQQHVTNAASYPPRCPSHVVPTTHARSVESPSPNSPHFFKPPNVNLASISLALSSLSVGGSSSMQPSSPTSDANPLLTQRSPLNHQQPTSLSPTGFPVFAAPWV